MLKTKMRQFRDTGLFWIWIAIGVIIIDYVCKQWIVAHLVLGESLSLLPFFSLTLAHNTGAAFSFMHTASGWQNVFFGVLAVVVALIMTGWLARLRRQDIWLGVALALIIGGALGNALDRVMYGYVVDFLHFYLGDWHFAIFNVADSAICTGAVMVILHWIVYRQ